MRRHAAPPLLFVLTAMLLIALLPPVDHARAHGPYQPPARAAIGAATARIEQLTLGLTQLNSQYQSAAGASKTRLESDLLAAAVARKQELLTLVETNPAEFLRLALPSRVRAALPSNAQQHVEEEADLEGTLEILHEDGPTASRYIYGLYTAFGKLSLRFADDDGPDDVLTGSRVRVRGVRLAQVLAAGASSTGSVQTLTAALPNTLGPQRTVVILVNFADKATQPYTADYVRNIVFTTTSNFDLENSYHQTWLTGDVVGWYTIPLSSAVCDYQTLAAQARHAAAGAGVGLSNYTRYVYVFPKNACGWSGIGSVGGNPSQAWINGTVEFWVVAHEMGHNLGLYHSHGYNCSAGIVSGCSVNEYGDTFDVMGYSRSNHFNSFQKERLGWLNSGTSPSITTVTEPGTYTLEPYETPGGVKALKVLYSTDPLTGRRSYYYLEYRQPIGFDTSLSSYTSVLNGVVARTASETSGNSSYLLDLTPPPYPAVYNPALAVGDSYEDSTAGITITPVWASGSTAGVSIGFGGQQCVQRMPAIAVSPSQAQWAPASATVTYTASITNHDSSACPSSSFILAAAAPPEWSTVVGTPSVVVAPGATASAVVSVTSAASAASGYYTVSLNARDAADTLRSAVTSATYVIPPSVDVSVSTDQPAYRANQFATITTKVSTNGSMVVGATVTVTITRPNGTITKLSATTDATGAASVKHHFKRQDPTGTYLVRATATQGNGSVGEATTTVLLQ